MKKYALIVENNKELKDYIAIINNLSIKFDLFVKIIFLAEIYKDNTQYESLKEIDFNYELLVVENNLGVPFVKMSFLEKLKIVLLNRKKMLNFINDCNVLLSGIQTVFERCLFNDIKKYNLNINVITYHRHLLFDDGVNTNLSENKLFVIKRSLSKIFGLDWIFIDNKGVGFSDMYLVLGEINRKYLMSKGVDSDKISILGSLEYDHVPQRTQSSEAKSICYITGAFEWIGDLEGDKYQDQKIVEYLDLLSRSYEKFNIWIRVHPRENIKKYEKLKQKYSFLHIQQSTGNSLLNDLSKFDILIGGLSTALFEGSLLGNNRILFVINKNEFYRYKSLINDINLPFFYSIRDAMDNMVSGTEIKDKNIIMYIKDEKALSRMVDFIEKI